MSKPKIVGIVGSLRKDSFNFQLAQAAQRLVGDRALFEILDYSDVPLLNQDIEHPAPESVRRVRDQVREADGVWFFTPEYNHSYPAALKNIIDWLSRPGDNGEPQVLFNKPAAISGISPGMGGTVVAQDMLVILLSFLNMRIMNVPRLTIPNAMTQLDENGRLKLTASAPYLEKQVDAFLAFVAGK